MTPTDVNTGERLWEFQHSRACGTLGGDTWGGLDNLYRKGGENLDLRAATDPELS